MSQLSDIDTIKSAQSYFSAQPNAEPTLDDLLNRVGSDFTYNYMQQRELEDRVRAAQAMPGYSAHTPISGLRGAIGNGLRAIADKYFTPGGGSFNFSGFKRI